MARYMVKFEKGKGIKFISHLDLMRAFQRAIRRAGIPITYSKGFNPHAEISFATPLPVGTWSMGEYLEMGLDIESESKEIMQSLNRELPGEIRVLSVREIPDDTPPLMSAVDAASYRIIVSGAGQVEGISTLEDFMDLKAIEVEKVGKNGTRNVDIKPMIKSISFESKTGDTVVLRAETDCGSRSNLNPELLYGALKKYAAGFEGSALRDINKLETYIKKGEALKTLEQL